MSTAFRPGDWNCNPCGAHNFRSRSKCRECHAPASKWGSGSIGTGESHPTKPGDWLCASCRAHNFRSRSRCYKCSSPCPTTTITTAEATVSPLGQTEDPIGADLEYPPAPVESEELLGEDEIGGCVICYEHKANVLLLPCAHLILCRTCASNKTITTCPMCRGSIVKFLVTYS